MATKVTIPALRYHKVSSDNKPLVMLTAYDFPGARMADEAGADIILVGDSLAMVVLGYEDTLQVTIDDMAHHTAAVARAKPRAVVVGDLPWLSYHLSHEDSVTNAAKLIRAGAQAVKLEGGAKRASMVSAIVDAEIPVMGHLGLTPQSVHALGGFRVQGKEAQAVAALLEDAKVLVDAGVFAIVLECIPREVAKLVTASVPVPTIGIGAGPECDGQVLVFHDVLGLHDRQVPKFVRSYGTNRDEAIASLRAFGDDVRSGLFPSDQESYHANEDLSGLLKELYGS